MTLSARPATRLLRLPKKQPPPGLVRTLLASSSTAACIGLGYARQWEAGLHNRLESEVRKAREDMAKLPPSIERDALLYKIKEIEGRSILIRTLAAPKF